MYIRLYIHIHTESLDGAIQGLPGIRVPRLRGERGELRRCIERLRAPECLGAGGMTIEKHGW